LRLTPFDSAVTLCRWGHSANFKSGLTSMCNTCESLSRRQFIGKLALTGVTLGAASLGLMNQPAQALATTLSPDAALQKLKDGNAKFVKSPELCSVDITAKRTALAAGQAPWATILTCADSRVSPELIFGGLNLGELFVCRNAGNQADVDAIGSIEYAAEHLGSPLVVVLGHERCGAIAAACDVVGKGAKLDGYIGKMVSTIVPAAKALKGKPGDYIDNVVRENAKRGAAKILSASSEVKHLVETKAVKVVYARYDLTSGAVDFLG